MIASRKFMIGPGSHDCHTRPYGLRQERAFCDFALLCFPMEAAKTAQREQTQAVFRFPDLFGADFFAHTNGKFFYPYAAFLCHDKMSKFMDDDKNPDNNQRNNDRGKYSNHLQKFLHQSSASVA